MTMQARGVHLLDFMFYHGSRHGLFAKFCLIKCISETVFCNDIKFAVLMLGREIVVVFSNEIEGLRESAMLILADEELTTNCFKEMRDVGSIKIVCDVAVPKIFWRHDLALRRVAMEISVVECRQWVGDGVAGAFAVVWVVDGYFFLDDFHLQQTFQNIGEHRTAQMRLGQDVAVAVKAACQCFEHFICVLKFR